MKVLHLSFHKGCINEINFICKSLGVDCEVLSQNIDWNTNKQLLPLSEPFAQHYNITHERAEKYWNTYNEYFNKFDCIITSDTAPLSRILLQNNWNKPLIIWICNRFNYTHHAPGITAGFPDQEFYELFKKATNMPNVKIYGYTQFENVFCKNYGIDIENVIQPSGGISSIYQHVEREEYYKEYIFIVPYHNETKMMNLHAHLDSMQIKATTSAYNGPLDLLNYKAVIHIPYALSNLALFEIFQVGLVYFVPSFEFLNELFSQHSNHWFQDKDVAFTDPTIIEWYNPSFKDCFIYFNSWDDLKNKIHNTNYDDHKQNVLDYGKTHLANTLKLWKNAL